MYYMHVSSKMADVLVPNALSLCERTRQLLNYDLNPAVRRRIKGGTIVKMVQEQKGLVSREGLSYATGLSPQALNKYEEAGSSQLLMVDPRSIKTHPRFEGMLSIDEELSESLTVDMAVGGYYPSIPIVLAIWPGQEEPVLIDGHTRRKASIAARIQEIPAIIESFDDKNGALEYIAKVQTHRRPNDDWVRYQLIIEIDSLMDRGGDRRSERAKSKGSQEPIEIKYANSAERTAALVGTSLATVKRARRIRKAATPEILEALKNGTMTITQAANAIADEVKAQQIPAELPATENRERMVQLTDENIAVLRELGETVHYHTNKAVRMYIRGLRKMGRLPEE